MIVERLLALLQDRIDAPGMKQCADSAADFQAYGGAKGRNEMLRMCRSGAWRFWFSAWHRKQNVFHQAVTSFSLENALLGAA